MKNKFELTEDSIIDWSSSMVEYRKFFIETYGITKPGNDFYFWINVQTGRTLKEAFEMYGKNVEPKSMEDLLSEARFAIVSETDKTFIIAFDKCMAQFGCDFGGSIGRGDINGMFMIVYTKAKKVLSRIFIREGGIVLKLLLSDVKRHTSYIEGAPDHIKKVFIGENGDCACSPPKEACGMRKTYTIDGKPMVKCSEKIFLFVHPTIDRLSDYMNLLKEFYQAKTH